MAKHNELGAKGEELAKQLLVGKGYQILHTNWRYKHEEIDIIARTG
ncbi:MAG: YraN family protein [Paludibacteraceae bacterium]|nr:YraN family protein [Paludibacteraceae bacterium]